MGAADPHPPQTGTPAVSEATGGTHPAVARLLALWPWASAVFSGVLLSLCFAPRNWGGLCWLALTPLLAALWFGAQTSPLRRFLLGYTTGITFFTLTFSWLSALGELYGDPMLRGIPLLLALYMGLYPAVWAWIVGILCDGRRESFLHSGTNLATGLAGAAVGVVLEWIRGWLFSGFGWTGLPGGYRVVAPHGAGARGGGQRSASTLQRELRRLGAARYARGHTQPQCIKRMRSGARCNKDEVGQR